MKRLFWRVAPEGLLGSLLFLSAGGCDPNQSVQAGPPQLLSFSVVSNTTFSPLDITSDAGAVPVSGFVHLTALFDRLLDPVPVTGLDGGMDFGADTNTVTITPAPPGGMVTFQSIYVPNGDPMRNLVFAAGPSITTTASPTLPSKSTIKAVLDHSKIRSKKGETFAGDAELTFQTLPFAAQIDVPQGETDPDGGADAGMLPVAPQMQSVTITFTNLPADDIADHITVTAGGTPYAGAAVAADASGNPLVFTVTPATTWPANATIEVTVDATAADALGVMADAPARQSFTTGSM
jgi:Big-like domain-containing protein